MSNETDMARHFSAEVADHEMVILRDDGLYRHLRFVRNAVNPKSGQRERSSFYWFDLITWPGCLAVNGDCGSFTFSRLDDMFEFFRGHEINPGYWAEKVRAGRGDLKRYSADKFRRLVTDEISSGDEEFPGPAQDWPGLAEAVEEEIFGEDSPWNTEYEDGAREALTDFAYGDTSTVRCSCGEEAAGLTESAAVRWRGDHRTARGSLGHTITIVNVEGFRFTETWEWDLGDWDWQFLWCCHAIVWGIRQYDEGRGTARRPTETVEVPA